MSRKLTLDEMRRLAEARGGHCLSIEYIDQTHALEWQCEQGHVWSAPAGQVKDTPNKRGTWCPTCARLRRAKPRRTVEDMQRLAAKHGGQFRSDQYLGSSTRHLWSCREFPDHPAFSMLPNSVQQGQWCPRCAGNTKPTLSDLNALAKRRNPTAQCLSTDYVNSTTPLEWVCGVSGHPPFMKSYRSVKFDGGWCRLCRSHKTTYTKQMLIALAKQNGGALLTDGPYRNTKQRLKWRCADGHEFDRTLDSIRSYHSFCPHCSRTWGLREQYVRSLFSHLLGVNFPRRRDVSWLTNAAGARMELDGYNEELRLAFEYQGSQHYGVDGFFLNDDAGFAKRREDDALKLKLCKAHDVTLVVIPFSVGWTHMQDFVSARLTAEGVTIIDDSRFAPGVVSFSRVQELQDRAIRLGGKLLSARYLGSAEPLRWKCSNPEHRVFEATPNSVLSGRWCDKCADAQTSARYRVSVEQVQAWARAAGGELLLSELNPRAQDLGLQLRESAVFVCSRCGHERRRRVREVKSGSLCLCATNKVRVDRNKVEAALAGKPIVIVAPTEVTGGKTELELRCEQCGKVWTKRASSVVNAGSGHKSCNRGVTMEKAQAVGQRAGFALLSTEVRNGTEVLEWECLEARHPISLPYRSMRNRRCCPDCEGRQVFAKLLGSAKTE